MPRPKFPMVKADRRHLATDAYLGKPLADQGRTLQTSAEKTQERKRRRGRNRRS